jgi:hypothetical protein
MKKLTTILITLAFFAFGNIALAAKPYVNLHPATNITANSATLSLSYTSDSNVSAVMFNYSTDASFGSNSQIITTNDKTVNISGLISAKRYYYRATVNNNDGSTIDPISGYYYFDTLGGSSTQTPYSETLGEESVTTASMTLTGRVNTYGAVGTAYYKLYNSNCTSLITTTGSSSLTATTGSQYVRNNVSGLNSNTSYCSELIATVNGVSYSGGKVIVKTYPGSTIPPTSTCVINSFYSDASSVYTGESTTLRWSTTNCASAKIGNSFYDNANPNGSLSTGALYSTTSYILTAYGNNTVTKTISVGVLPKEINPTPNPNPTYPSCYYNSSCYWNGTTWVYYSVNPIPNPAPNPNTNYPSCYYNSTCYYNGTTWVYRNNTVLDNYSYNPHTPYTGGPNYVYKTLPGEVKTVYVDQQVQGEPINQVVTQPVDYNYYNNGYNSDIMNRYPNAYYDNNDLNNRVLLTGSAGNTGRITFIGLLIALIIIGIIVYFVRANQRREIH